MADWSKNMLRLIPSLLVCWLVGLPLPLSADWPPPSYAAVYEVLMDGKPRVETSARFTREGDTWRFENTGNGTKGLARFLGIETTESASGTWENTTTLPLSFSHEAKIALKKDAWTAQFDWENARILTSHEEGESVLPLERGTVDPLGITLALQSNLHQQRTEWTIQVVDEDEIDEQKFRAKPAAPLQTALGCVQAIEVERVRDNNKRYSSIWFAPELSFVTVQMVHGKRDGHEFEMRIRELTLDGQTIALGADCGPGT